MTNTALIQKYNVPGPRYTSYPTVPFWDADTFSEATWVDRLQDAFRTSNREQGISLYIHLPYCESLCTFCGCNKRITKNHSVEEPYIEAVLKEWALYCNLLPERPKLAELHLGGGTPSFFKPENLRRLMEGLFARADRADEYEYGWEGHPNNTTREHLQTLHDFGFTRVSFGVQDYDPVVQKAIHRFQPFENVQKATELAREVGYTSISHDLVFGLPFQQPESIENTVEKTLLLKPDRISFYSYAHVPWIKGNGQRGFRDEDLPSGEEKRHLYEIGRALFEKAGYAEIGMDHFALPHDALYKAMQQGTLHRNFMGYTTTRTKVMLGLGVSSIGDVWTAFAQNEKDLDVYLERVNAGRLPLLRGHGLNREDLYFRKHILNIMCRFETHWHRDDWKHHETDFGALAEKLAGFEADGLIEWDLRGLTVKPEGRPFIRNICMAFDQRMLQAETKERLFSQTI
ncbi:oxygen-independent coproporphyrinogen III oxidase [Tellurirhabdus rosea]|uniref:oxygen-independent coproporphyrinogen III oxidase n=1 Tax=Tellurirhabdus rosea TaxID=2674997 RepID=UPI00224EDF54|nr:oxygen-independent coproporphyrinogen III oxidase [Tellurirhabdus rosea]